MSYKYLVSIIGGFTFFFRSVVTRRRNIMASLLCGVLATMIIESSWADIFDTMNSNYSNTRMTYRSMLKKCGYTAEQLNSMHLSNKEMLALIAQECQHARPERQDMPTGQYPSYNAR